MNKVLLGWLLVLATPLAGAQAFDPIQDVVERHLRLQLQGTQGTIQIQVSKPDVSRLPACQAHEPFSPPGSRLLGKTTVGVRCLGPSAWSILVPAQVSVLGSYLTTARALMAGQVVQASDLSLRQGDLSQLPTGLLSEPAQAIGKSLKVSLGAGMPIRSDVLVAPQVIRQNQMVKVISRGAGFSASAEGKAMTAASEGQNVNVRMPSGQVVSGTARGDGSVEISY